MNGHHQLITVSVVAALLVALPATTAHASHDNAATNTAAIQVTQAEQQVKATPKDPKAWTRLGSLFVRRAYETADPSFYPPADRALDRATSLSPNSPDVLIARAGLALAKHQFSIAKDLASKALVASPNSFDARLALVDASIELGDYDSAADQIDRLTDQRTGVASLSRLSYLRQLNGDLIGAETAMRAAVSSAPENSIDRAVALGYLGDVLLERGKGPAAAAAYNEALRINPLSAVAVMGKARIAAGDAQWTTASGLLDRLTERVPLPGALGQVADLARARNDRPGLQAADQLVDASVALFRANGAVVDSELAVLLADRGPAAGAASLTAARIAFAARRTIFTNDAMAWSLLQNGRAIEAVPFARSAVATAPAVASVRWHAATVFAAAGDAASARRELKAALANRWFSAAQRPAVLQLAKKLGVQT